MTTIPELSSILQDLLTTKAEQIARKTGFIQRARKVTGAGFAQALVLGGMGEGVATRAALQQRAAQAGMVVSVQALDQRFSARAVAFMRELLEAGLKQMVESADAGEVLSGFQGVYLTDCTQVQWEGSGIKLGVRLELQRGGVQVCWSPLNCHDQTVGIIEQPLPAGALHLGDLGFFKLARFQQWNQQGVYWLSRLKLGTTLRDPSGQTLDLTQRLTGTEALVLPVRVGVRHPVDAFLLAAPLTEEALTRRQTRMQDRARRNQRPASPQQTALAGWTIDLTNLPDLSFAQAHILARTRWQIELLFKLWKSHARLQHSRSANPLRQQCEGYAKLLGILSAHWSLLVTRCPLAHTSPLHAFRVFRTYVPLLVRALACPDLFRLLFYWIHSDLAALPPLSKRGKVPLAFQLWQQFDYVFP